MANQRVAPLAPAASASRTPSEAAGLNPEAATPRPQQQPGGGGPVARTWRRLRAELLPAAKATTVPADFAFRWKRKMLGVSLWLFGFVYLLAGVVGEGGRSATCTGLGVLGVAILVLCSAGQREF